MNKARKESARNNFRLFCETYLARTFCNPWTVAQGDAIRKIEWAVLDRVFSTIKLPRGGGASSLSEAACLWAVLCGHHQCVALVNSSEDTARESLANLKDELRHNDLVGEDFLTQLTRRMVVADRGNQDWGARRCAWLQNPIAIPVLCDDIESTAAIFGTSAADDDLFRMGLDFPGQERVPPSLMILDSVNICDPDYCPSARAKREVLVADICRWIAGSNKIGGFLTVTSPAEE